MLSKRERTDFCLAVALLNFVLTGALLGYLAHTEAENARERESLENPLSAVLPASPEAWGGIVR